MKYITPIILLTISILSFLMFTNPTYQEIKNKNTLIASYDSALDNAEQLQTERDALTTKYNSFAPSDLTRLSQLLPDDADNIRFIINLQNMAQAYGMTIGSTKFDASAASAAGSSSLTAGSASDVAQATKDYGVFDLEFTTTATYPNFLSFLKDVESSLRLSDVQSIEFSSDTTGASTAGTPPAGVSPGNAPSTGYLYTVKIRTYWLKPTQ